MTIKKELEPPAQTLHNFEEALLTSQVISLRRIATATELQVNATERLAFAVEALISTIRNK